MAFWAYFSLMANTYYLASLSLTGVSTSLSISLFLSPPPFAVPFFSHKIKEAPEGTDPAARGSRRLFFFSSSFLSFLSFCLLSQFSHDNKNDRKASTHKTPIFLFSGGTGAPT
jgi:hypothetical protein